jgi:hypothetical protein
MILLRDITRLSSDEKEGMGQALKCGSAVLKTQSGLGLQFNTLSVRDIMVVFCSDFENIRFAKYDSKGNVYTETFKLFKGDELT